MTNYTVTAPLVVIPNIDGESGDGYFYQDARVPADWNPERCEQLAAEGMLADVVEPAGEPVGPPAKSASKGDWEAYARSQGATDADLDGATKDELIELYGETSA